MSLKPIDLTPILEETARIAKSALPKGNIYLKLRDELGALYRVLSVTGLYLSHALPNVSDYEEPVPEPPY
jgi:transposase